MFKSNYIRICNDNLKMFFIKSKFFVKVNMHFKEDIEGVIFTFIKLLFFSTTYTTCSVFKKIKFKKTMNK